MSEVYEAQATANTARWLHSIKAPQQCLPGGNTNKGCAYAVTKIQLPGVYFVNILGTSAGSCVGAESISIEQTIA